MKRSRFQKVRLIIVALILGSVIFGLGFFVGNAVQLQQTTGDDLRSIFTNRGGPVDFSLISDVWNLISDEYVHADTLDRNAVIFGAIRGMLDAIGDPYTVFFDTKETKEFLETVSGRFDGIGTEIGIRDNHIVVIAPLKDTPAFRAGLQAQDRIIKINGETTEGLALDEAVNKIRGPKGTSVTLTIHRNGEQRDRDITIVRETIEVPSVRWEMLDGNIAYIELTHFSETTDRDFDKAAQEILESNADRIILDMRNNPGGFLDGAINVAGWFIPKDKVVVLEETKDKTRRTHVSSGPGAFEHFPTVVLQNKGSASAAEILAGALRDQNHATLVGEKSFGKGSVQSFENLKGGTSVKITVALWLTPSGQSIHEVGIEPSVLIEGKAEDFEAGRDPQKDKAIEVVKSLR